MKTRGLSDFILYFFILVLAGCHGGGGGEQAPTTIISGIASKGPINAATVTVFAVRNGNEDRSASLGQGVTDDKGNYTVDLGSYAGPVLIEAVGGSFTDEVTGASVHVKAPMRAVISTASTGTQTAAITPLTELAYQKASGAGSLSPAAIDDANSRIASFFGLGSIISTLPDAGGAGDDQKKYAAVVASFAQYVNNNRNADESPDDALSRLLTQMGDEVKTSGGLSIGTINGINTAIADFNESGKNNTGAAATLLPAPTTGFLKLSTSGATLIGAIDVTVEFPAGVTVHADAATGEAAEGVVTASGAAAASNCLSSAKFTGATSGSPARLHVGLITVTGFGPGEFVTIRFDVDAGASFPANTGAFPLTILTTVGTDGSSISGITASPSTVAAEIK